MHATPRLEDARHYCAFHKKRLPHVHEWQYFAQGTDGRLFPWGAADDASKTSPRTLKYKGGVSLFKTIF